MEKTFVYLDSNFLIKQGRNLTSPRLRLLESLARSNTIKILTTDLTKKEVVKKLVANAFEAVGVLSKPHIREISSSALGYELKEISADEIRKKLHTHFEKVSDSLYLRLGANEVSIDKVKPNEIFREYSESLGFFGGNAKKNQFPDAFIFAALIKKATPPNRLVILTEDKDFNSALDGREHLHVVKSVDDLFQHLGFMVEGPDISEFIDLNIEIVIDLFSNELDSFGIEVGDVEDGEIYDFSIDYVDIEELNTFAPTGKNNELLAVGKAEIRLTVEFSHPDWASAIYDKEDDVRITFGNVEGSVETSVTVDFSMLVEVDSEGEPTEVATLNLDSRSWLYVNIEEDYW